MSLNYVRKFLEKLFLGTTVTVTMYLGAGVNAANAGEYTFRCDLENDLKPTTLVVTEAGEKPFIVWNSDYFLDSGYTKEDRCREVTGRLKTLFAQGSRVVTHGNINGWPVICTANEVGGKCVDLVYTLKQHQDPDNVLGALLSYDAANIDATDDKLFESTRPTDTKLCPIYLEFRDDGEIAKLRACEPK